MKKFSVLIIVCAIILTVALAAYNQTVTKVIVAEDNYSLYRDILDKSNTDFKNKAVAFTPFEVKITDGDEKAYMDDIIASSDKLEGYISPSAVYYVTTPVSGGNAYITDENFFEYCLKGVNAEGFNYAPSSAEDITVVLGSAYKDAFKAGGNISIRIRGEEETFTLNAKITDILDNSSFDPVNQTFTDYGVYVGDLAAIVGEEPRHDSEDRVYSVLYTGDIKDAKAALFDYGFADDSFNYFSDAEILLSSYDTTSSYAKPIAVACALCMAAAFAVYASAILFNLKKSDDKVFQKTITSVVVTVLIAVVYIAISFGKIAIPSAILTLIPYIFTLAILVGICIAGSFKKERA